MPVFGVFLVRMQENADQKNSEYRHILRSVFAITCSVHTFKRFSTIFNIRSVFISDF